MPRDIYLVDMEPAAATTLSAWLRRFARWFFTVSPDVGSAPAPRPRAKSCRTKGRRRALSPMGVHRAGRIRVVDWQRP
jgi:hypothetical protein